MTVYAIGDIHGHLGLLHAAHARIEADRTRHGTETAPVIHIGDLVDRGPNSAGVVDFLAHAATADPRIVILKGNHDLMLVNWLEAGPGRGATPVPYLSDRVGGRPTLASYGLDITQSERALWKAAQAAVPKAHRRFLNDLPLMHQTAEAVFVHAGIRPGLPVNAQEARDLLWIREPFLLDTGDHGALIVHGHTPTESRRPEHHGNRLAIDSGAAYGGPLSAVAIEDDGRAWELTPQGRAALRPMPVRSGTAP
jgi:serine/threonine protein phosphatase 1